MKNFFAFIFGVFWWFTKVIFQVPSFLTYHVNLIYLTDTICTRIYKLGQSIYFTYSIVYISGKEAGSKHWNYKERDRGANWSWNWAQAKAWSDDWSFNSETSPGLSSNILDNSVGDFLYLFLFDEWGGIWYIWFLA